MLLALLRTTAPVVPHLWAQVVGGWKTLKALTRTVIPPTPLTHHVQRWLDLARAGRAKCSRKRRIGIPQVRFPLSPRLPQGPAPWITAGDQAVRPSGSGLSGRSWKLE